MKILAIDYGTKRIGLAVSDELGITASPLPVLKWQNENQAVSEILKTVSLQNCQKILIGIPTGYKESPNLQTQIVLDFVAQLKAKLSKEVKVILWDESYSSKQAIANLKKRKEKIKNKIDSESAKILLLEYLNSDK